MVYLNIPESNNIQLQYKSFQRVLASLKIQAKMLKEPLIVVVLVVPLSLPLLESATPP